MVEKNLSIENIDKNLTKKWLSICVERFSFKLPYSIINYSMHNYNNLKFEVIPNQNINSFNALVDKRRREIKVLEKPEGLSSNIRREEKQLGSYFVTYRAYGNRFPNFMNIEGYFLANNFVIKYKTSTKDGYLSKNKEILDELFEEEYLCIKSIKDNLLPIFDKKRVEKGFCIEDKALIKLNEKEFKSAYVSAHFRNKFFRGFIRIKYGANTKKYFPFEKNKLENELVEISKCTINGYEGVLSKVINKTTKDSVTYYNAEYFWGYENVTGDSENPLIIINLKESFKSPYIQQKQKDSLDSLFYNILASFSKR